MKEELLSIQNLFITSLEKYINQGFSKINIELCFLDKDDLVEYIAISLDNKIINRSLYFRYQPYNGPKREFVAEFVWFSVKEINSGKSILLQDYWKQKKGDEHRIVSLKNQLPDKTLEERFTHYLSIVKETLETDLKLVVEGKEWFDLPFDWSPYK